MSIVMPSDYPWTYFLKLQSPFPAVQISIQLAVQSAVGWCMEGLLQNAMMSLTDGKVPRAGQIFVLSKSASKELLSATTLDVEGCGSVTVFCSSLTVDRLMMEAFSVVTSFAHRD